MRNNKVIEQLKLRLGTPTVSIELSDEQFEEAIRTAKEEFEFIVSIFSEEEYKKKLKIKSTWVKRYALAICKEMLGRVRGKFNPPISLPGAERVPLDAKELLKESEYEKNFLFRCVNDSLGKFVLLNNKNV